MAEIIVLQKKAPVPFYKGGHEGLQMMIMGRWIKDMQVDCKAIDPYLCLPE